MERFCFGWKALHHDIEAGEADAGEKKNLVQLSQQRLDELIGRAFARGARNGGAAQVESAQDEKPAPAREADHTAGGNGGAAAPAALEDTGDSVDSSKGAAVPPSECEPPSEAAPAADGGPGDRMAQLAEARDTLRLANQRLLEAMVMQQAQDAGLSARGAAAALRMCDFGECMEGGAPEGPSLALARSAETGEPAPGELRATRGKEPLAWVGAPSEGRVKNRLQGFAASWPEFALCAPPAPFAAGTGSVSIQQDVLKNALGVL